MGVIHRKVRDRRNDLLLQTSHRLTAKGDVLKVETLNVRGMGRNHHLALSVADAGMGRLVTFCEYKADWRGRTVEKIDPWFPSSQLCCVCGVRPPRCASSGCEGWPATAATSWGVTAMRPSTSTTGIPRSGRIEAETSLRAWRWEIRSLLRCLSVKCEVTLMKSYNSEVRLLRKDILRPSERHVERSSIYGAQPLHQTLLIKRADLIEQDQACLPLKAHMDPERR